MTAARVMIIVAIVMTGLVVTMAVGKGPTSQPAGLATTASAPAVIPLGKGLTNALYIDADGDGFGVGSPVGPDADDTDKAVNTPASVKEKYGTLAKFLAARGVSGRSFYISPTGSDTAGHANNPDRPYATFAKVAGQLAPGDAAVFQAGKYDGERIIVAKGLRGREAAPIFILAQPGAAVVLDTTEACIDIDSCRNLVIDGFVCGNTQSTREGRGVTMKFSRGITLANLDIANHFWGIIAMQDLHDVTIQSCVIHDNPHEHGIYLGSREQPNSGLTVRDCLIYRNAQQGFQHNGRVKKLLLEGNIIHSNGQAGVQLMQGVCESAVRGNVIFNNGKQGICLYNYDSSDDSIRAFDQTGNVFEDNIVWVGREDPFGEYSTETYSAVLFNDSTKRKGGSFDGNTFRRNVLVTSDGPAFYFRQERFASKTVIEDNVIFRTGDGGKAKVMLFGEKPFDFAGFVAFSKTFKGNAYADPKFTACRTEDFKTPEKFDFSCPKTGPVAKMRAATQPSN